MSEPFLGEIKIASFNYAPTGWALCAGQLLPINQNQALFSLLGTSYGGDGRVNFGLPDLRGRVPMHIGSGFIQGEKSGSYAVTVQLSNLAPHSHPAYGDDGGALLDTPANALLGTNNVGTTPQYLSNKNNPQLVTMNPAMVTNTGGNQPFNPSQPYLALTMMIALTGIFPSRN